MTETQEKLGEMLDDLHTEVVELRRLVQAMDDLAERFPDLFTNRPDRYEAEEKFRLLLSQANSIERKLGL